MTCEAMLSHTAETMQQTKEWGSKIKSVHTACLFASNSVVS